MLIRSPAGIVDHPAAIGSVIQCETCHASEIAKMDKVPFPSGAELGDLGASVPCAICHQGRQSTLSVSKAIGQLEEDTVSPDLAFINVHYRAAAATMMGTLAKGGYEYQGKTYMGRFSHVPTLATCTDCHDAHSLKVEIEQCSSCHRVTDLEAIRTSQTDFDGNDSRSEGISSEIAALHARLGAAIIEYSTNVAQAPIVYAKQFPYYFADSNANGVADGEEVSFPNRYLSWTPRLLKAAYNYQFVAQDPGAYAHNPHYAIQILYDSLESLSAKASVDMSGLARP